jgi:hypothetical protein
MSTIVVNGRTYHTDGGSVSNINGVVTVDGIRVDLGDEKEINIVVNGDISKLKVDYCKNLKVDGNVNELQTSSGDVECGNVTGSIQTSSGDVECRNVGGNIRTSSGDVKCGNISGDVNSMSGDIKYRR